MYYPDEYGVPTLHIPEKFNLQSYNTYNFSQVLKLFEWEFSEKSLRIDFTGCKVADFQTLSLLIQYLWYLKVKHDPFFTFDFPELDVSKKTGVFKMWSSLGALGWFQVLKQREVNFRSSYDKRLVAIRTYDDATTALTELEKYISRVDKNYLKSILYIVSELLNNTIEHGNNSQIPSLLQYNWYQKNDVLKLNIVDLGIGIKKHMEQTYPIFNSHQEAIRASLRSAMSGTFYRKKDPYYSSQNNQGMGLYVSSEMLKRINAEMFLLSGDGRLHISPRDVTAKDLAYVWPGTIAYLAINTKSIHKSKLNFQNIVSEITKSAIEEQLSAEEYARNHQLIIYAYNHFGSLAENKSEAIAVRDRIIIPAIHDEKDIIIDFDMVRLSPHSFLGALLATPVQILQMRAYKKIKIKNATSDIRETIDLILEQNT